MSVPSTINDVTRHARTDIRTITLLGVGNILLRDEGVGVRVIERLERDFVFPDNVRLVDGGVLGIRLMGIVADTDILIIIDAVRDRQPPGTRYRLEGDRVPRRVLAKQSMHQLDLAEVLALCSAAIDKTPETIVIGVEPEDITTMAMELTPTIETQMEPLVFMVLDELERLKIPYAQKQNAPLEK